MATAPPLTERRTELGDFLRGRRAQVQPEQVGLAGGGRRRTPGLRREELAQLAGVGLSWYTWLEQGRDVKPSASVLDALGRVLRLDAGERAHLFHLARVELPLPGGGYPTSAPPELAELVDALAPHLAVLLNPRSDVLAWNRPLARVMCDWGALPAERRNLLSWLLLDRLPANALWEDTARRTLARFRAEHARHPGDPGFAALVAELHAASAAFREWWPQHEVLAEQAGIKEIAHDELGPLRLHHAQTIPTAHRDLRLTVYAPADERTRAVLRGTVALRPRDR